MKTNLFLTTVLVLLGVAAATPGEKRWCTEVSTTLIFFLSRCTLQTSFAAKALKYDS